MQKGIGGMLGEDGVVCFKTFVGGGESRYGFLCFIRIVISCQLIMGPPTRRVNSIKTQHLSSLLYVVKKNQHTHTHSTVYFTSASFDVWRCRGGSDPRGSGLVCLPPSLTPPYSHCDAWRAKRQTRGGPTAPSPLSVCRARRQQRRRSVYLARPVECLCN